MLLFHKLSTSVVYVSEKRKEPNRPPSFLPLTKLLSGKNLNSNAHLQASDYALNMLTLLAVGKIKNDSIKLLETKFINTKTDLSWLDKFGDKYRK